MAERPGDCLPSEPFRPARRRRVVPDWEYRTAYVETFQVRLPARLHERLRAWAGQERQPAEDLCIGLIEEAVRRRREATP